jgi:hypothetical protein
MCGAYFMNYLYELHILAQGVGECGPFTIVPSKDSILPPKDSILPRAITKQTQMITHHNMKDTDL